MNAILEEYYLLRYNAAESTECRVTFQRNISPLSSESKNKLKLIPAWKQGANQSMTLKTEVICSSKMTLYPWRQHSSPLWGVEIPTECSSYFLVSFHSIESLQHFNRITDPACMLKIKFVQLPWWYAVTLPLNWMPWSTGILRAVQRVSRQWATSDRNKTNVCCYAVYSTADIYCTNTHTHTHTHTYTVKRQTQKSLV
jgi:hypothetical protein